MVRLNSPSKKLRRDLITNGLLLRKLKLKLRTGQRITRCLTLALTRISLTQEPPFRVQRRTSSRHGTQNKTRMALGSSLKLIITKATITAEIYLRVLR